MEEATPLKLSVIVPVYNAETTIRQCVDSILKTQLDKFEIILVDDGSTDASGKICDEYSLSYGCVKTFHIANSGVSAARNFGIKQARGEYVGFVDSDDWIEARMFHAMLEALNVSQAQIASCDVFLDYPPFEEPKNVVEKDLCLATEIYTREEAARQLVKGSLHGYSCNKLFRRDLIKDTFDVRFKQAEDLLFVAAYLKEIDKLVYLKVPFYHYRQKAYEFGKIPSHSTEGAYEQVIELYRANFRDSVKYIEQDYFSYCVCLRVRNARELNNKDAHLKQVTDLGIKKYWKSFFFCREIPIMKKFHRLFNIFFPNFNLDKVVHSLRL